ncbi:PREDICTED: PGC-1 and ERR-induced regulator in muscle protein 1 [Gekko japonicus]|uniref:PGC-1 and ERR-induced regulator in muscle protein 1 n=1 Tax=Gekko japonicus TaxID=146911 RepID=A0ABM1K0C6_GEKJA|nr:PREDICTED: PGC-1 and ERR-induced regulator in muscle protein 1 [Gekko japonicus]
MENFEYSIQLNDRDWAEFYLASEECSLTQAALATAEEPLPSDLDDAEVENRLIRVRVGPCPPPGPASCPPRGAPHRHLLAEEEVLSGSEDETDLGSVSRFLCDNSQCRAAFPQPSPIQRSQSSRVAVEPLAGLDGECGASFAAEGREPETGDRRADADRPLPEGDVAIQKAGFQGRISGPEAMEKPTCSVPVNVGASKGMEEQRRRPLGLALQQPTNDISQTASADIQFPLPVGSNAVCGNPESPESKDPNVHPTSSIFPSGETEGAEHPETGTKHLQVSLKAGAPSFQEKPSLFQGHSVPPLGTWPPSGPPSESHKEGVLESRSSEEENIADLKAEGQTDQSEDLVDSILKEEGQVDQETSSAGCKVDSQKAPEEPEASKCPRPTIITESRCSGTLDQHRETAALKAETQKGGVEEPCHHPGPALPLEGGTPSMGQGSQRSNLLEDNIPYCLPLENSLEGHLAVMTWPQDCDHSNCGNTQDLAEKTQGGVVEKRSTSDVGQDLPEMYGPDMYEYFFTDMEGACAGDSGEEKEMGLETLSSSNQMLAPSTGSQDSDSIAAGEATLISVPEVYEHFFNNGAQGRKSWKRLFLSMPASEARKAVRALKSLLSKPARLLRRRPPSPGTALRRGSHGKLVVFSPRLLEESQPRPEDLRMAVISPERPLQLALTHRDMCLGFVAFASWAVKTSNLQAPDAWKIVLLANFGTLSAIRYFRRQIMAEGEHGT